MPYSDFLLQVSSTVAWDSQDLEPNFAVHLKSIFHFIFYLWNQRISLRPILSLHSFGQRPTVICLSSVEQWLVLRFAWSIWCFAVFVETPRSTRLNPCPVGLDDAAYSTCCYCWSWLESCDWAADDFCAWEAGQGFSQTAAPRCLIENWCLAVAVFAWLGSRWIDLYSRGMLSY